MILSRHRVDLLGLDLAIDRLLHRDAMFRVVRTGDVRVDERSYVPRLGRGTENGRCRLSVIIRGHGTCWRASDGAFEALGPGAALLWPSLDDGYLALDPQAVVLELDWTPTLLAARPRTFDSGKIGLSRALLGCVEDQADRRRHAPSAWAVDVVAILRAAGAPLERTSALALHDPGAVPYKRINDGLDALLSRLDAQPAVVDLERALGLSPRQLARDIEAYHGYFGLVGAGGARGWRAYLRFYRLTVAAMLLGSDAARVDVTARALGYGSSVALCHAFQAAGLPTPRALAAWGASSAPAGSPSPPPT